MKTKRGIGIIFFRADNYIDVVENFQLGIYVFKYQTQLQIFHRSPPASLLHCIENILNHYSGNCRDSLTLDALIFTKVPVTRIRFQIVPFSFPCVYRSIHFGLRIQMFALS